ncbi:MAG: transcription termination/antitermination protein NusG [Holosporales bacterium]|jgi:transcriptional antiterminator NusG|nr:transcription termination/antitermination protein NusG [Holosporales bacterium]
MMQKARWYIVHVYSGSEDKTAGAILETAEKKGLRQYFEETLIPTEEVVELKGGERVNVNRKYYPGYILVKMVMNEDTGCLVRGIPRVSGFLGMKGRPTPVSEQEVARIMKKAQEASESPRSAITYDAGDQVKVMDGPFASFSGFVEEVDNGRQRLKVSVMIFGRATPVTLEYTQVAKV